MLECIRRDAAINAVKSLESSMPAKDNYAKGYDAAIGRALIAVREVSPVTDVQSVKCGWWECEFYNDVFDVYQADCSVCKRESTDKYDKVSESYEYCPHCGARMDGETNG